MQELLLVLLLLLLKVDVNVLPSAEGDMDGADVDSLEKTCRHMQFNRGFPSCILMTAT